MMHYYKLGAMRKKEDNSDLAPEKEASLDINHGIQKRRLP
jgi:hypothetical protein